MFLQGKQVSLRAMEPGDVDPLFRWENDMDSWRVSNTVAPFSRHLLQQYVNSPDDIYAARQLRLMIVHNDDGRTLGCIDLFDFEPRHRRAGVGVLIGEPSDRRSGFASEALELLTGYAHDVLLLHQLYCNITVDNTASLALFEKHGFRRTGHKEQWIFDRGKWLDEYFLQLMLSQPQSS